jgi:hypothetical protein
MRSPRAGAASPSSRRPPNDQSRKDIAVADLPPTSLIAQNQAFIAWCARSDRWGWGVFLNPLLALQFCGGLDDVAMPLLSLDLGGGLSVDSICILIWPLEDGLSVRRLNSHTSFAAASECRTIRDLLLAGFLAVYSLTRRSQRCVRLSKNANGFQKNAIVCSLITKLNISGSSHERGWMSHSRRIVDEQRAAFIFYRGVTRFCPSLKTLDSGVQ